MSASLQDAIQVAMERHPGLLFQDSIHDPAGALTQLGVDYDAAGEVVAKITENVINDLRRRMEDATVLDALVVASGVGLVYGLAIGQAMCMDVVEP